MGKRMTTFVLGAAGELKQVRSLTLAALLIAIYAVTYSPFAGNIIIVPGLIELRFGFLAIALAGMLLGPFMAMFVAVLGDFVGTILFYGGSFFFGYPISWTLMGLIFGCFLYKEQLSTARIIAASVVSTVVIDQCLTTLWQTFMGFGTFEALFVSRILRNVIMLPVKTILLVLLLRSVMAIYRKVRRTA